MNPQSYSSSDGGDPFQKNREFLVDIAVNCLLTVSVDASSPDQAREIVTDPTFVSTSFNENNWHELVVLDHTLEHLEPKRDSTPRS